MTWGKEKERGKKKERKKEKGERERGKNEREKAGMRIKERAEKRTRMGKEKRRCDDNVLDASFIFCENGFFSFLFSFLFFSFQRKQKEEKKLNQFCFVKGSCFS